MSEERWERRCYRAGWMDGMSAAGTYLRDRVVQEAEIESDWQDFKEQLREEKEIEDRGV